MTMENKTNKGLHPYLQIVLVILLSLAFILFTQQVKLWKDPSSQPITSSTFLGLGFLGLFSILGVIIKDLTNKININFVRNFPVLGWVSIVSIICCLLSPFVVESILAVNFLSITTPILAFAGVSVANQLVDLSKSTWKIIIISIFVFTGTYVGSALVAQLALFLSGKL